ncbi:LON peptidase substrate-binding domain-containing protein [Sphingomonas sp. BN140010]|uniref:LON peptidase substrate-binding domain-containing protein n=1 Tax=Sphingomonas arvum TaxID=2992113 RepID=A0ABT3JFD0_9SPHN|nr:LON peptidase substrate-binding domain-containing protein [Sphingomonas sp. BN140010]MCW3797714.1 LON peptidase substrate-binding domain-containing protein [Sphingomonas sp. BN140010]
MSGSPLRLPIFPLGGAILFPRTQLPLHIFEPRYRSMIEDASAGAARIGMIQPLGSGDDPQHPPLYRVGCVGEIVGMEELEDGRFNVVLQGSSRFKLIAEADVGTPYRQADVDADAFDDTEPEPLGLAQRAEVEREARRLGDAMGLTVDWDAVNRLDDEMLVNAIAQVAPFDFGAKQALLEAAALADRADLLVQLMQFLRMAVGGGDASPRLH